LEGKGANDGRELYYEKQEFIMLANMLSCRCRECKNIFESPSSDFGKKYHCVHCGNEFMLDPQDLVHYHLPKIIEIQVITNEGLPFTEFAVPILVDYGYCTPPLKTDEKGHIVITQELLLEAKQEEISGDIMGSKYNDYSLNRYLILRVLSQKIGSQKASARMNSGWPLSDQEKRIYGNMEKLVEAFKPSEEIAFVEKFVDLSQENEHIVLDITIIPE
jgi:hypothetical protein